MIEQGKAKKQDIKLFNRRMLEISGILNVNRFDSEQFLLETELGFLHVKGQNLHIKSLNLEQGYIHIEGIVNSLQYMDVASSNKSKSILGKLFK
jgi:sporulation protein YabP